MLLGVLLAAALSLFLLNVVDATLAGRVFLGADAQDPGDVLQYLAWATDAGHHGLIANLYGLHFGSRVFLDPVWLVTGLLHVRVGLSYPLLLAIWKLLALLILFMVVRAYARSILGGNGRAVTVAMLIALFMVTPAYLVANRLLGARSWSGTVNLETFSVYWLEGYFPIALAVAAMITFLMQAHLLVSEDEPRGGVRRAILIASAMGLAASWLHPWQGMTLIAIVGGLVLWDRDSWRRHLRLLVPVLATAAPIVYFAVLSRVDAAWAWAQGHWSGGIASGYLGVSETFLITLLPVVLLMLPGYARRATTPAERMVRLWPIAIVIVYGVSPSDRFHAFAGWSVPAGLLMVEGWPWVRRRLPHWFQHRANALAVAGVCVAVAAAPVAIAQRMIKFRRTPGREAQISRDDAQALDSVPSLSRTGGVLTTAQLGVWVPAVTDHPTWVGHSTWTPDQAQRSRQAALLFSGSLDHDPSRERVFVRSTGATFVLEPCGSRARLNQALLPAGFRVMRIGCATLYSKE